MGVDRRLSADVLHGGRDLVHDAEAQTLGNAPDCGLHRLRVHSGAEFDVLHLQRFLLCPLVLYADPHYGDDDGLCARQPGDQMEERHYHLCGDAARLRCDLAPAAQGG